MTDKTVSYPVAKALLEAGFNEPTQKQYGNKTQAIYDNGKLLRNSEIDTKSIHGLISAPTSMQATKWVLDRQTELYTVFCKIIAEM